MFLLLVKDLLSKSTINEFEINLDDDNEFLLFGCVAQFNFFHFHFENKIRGRHLFFTSNNTLLLHVIRRRYEFCREILCDTTRSQIHVPR